jgi:hypothetical protein
MRNRAGLDIDPDATAGQPCPRTAVRKAVIARVTISLSVKPLITDSPTMFAHAYSARQQAVRRIQPF